jgi:hypothetical protein
VTDRFQDGRRRHVGNSNECNKMGKYHPISLKIGTQTRKTMLSSKITEAKVQAKFQDDAADILSIQMIVTKCLIVAQF